MKAWQDPSVRPPESAFIILDPDVADQKRKNLFKWLESVFPRFNWRSHIFVINSGQGDGIQTEEELIQIGCCFLEENGFATLYVHPFVKARHSDARQREEWEKLISPARSFQKQAYELQSETRLYITPIIDLRELGEPGEASIEEALNTAGFFSSRLATPSLYLPGRILEGLVERADNDEIRFFIDPDKTGLAAQLWVSHVFETLLGRVIEEEQTLLFPCTPHLVVDEKRQEVFSCFKQWEAGESGVSFDQAKMNDPVLPGAVRGDHCPGCIGRSVLSMRENIMANNRVKEGRQVCFKLALALAEQKRHGLAAGLAHHAFELSDSNEDRAAALVHEGLCLRDSRKLEEADEVLKLADEYSKDKGLIAYHRGRVQFDWRDYIEALDRFEEALEYGSQQVPIKDMCFEMALCHINIEEYKEARPYLDRSLAPGQKTTPVSFYRGICELGEAKVQTALDHFEEALQLGPSEEDLGRVLFYIGTCYKELELFEDAIDVLKKAIKADPEDLTNHNLLGFCYYKTKQHEKAVECFRLAVEIDPHSAIDWANLGSNLRDLGSIEEAIEAYKKALSLDPTIGFARENLARLTKLQ